MSIPETVPLAPHLPNGTGQTHQNRSSCGSHIAKYIFTGLGCSFAYLTYLVGRVIIQDPTTGLGGKIIIFSAVCGGGIGMAGMFFMCAHAFHKQIKDPSINISNELFR